MKDSFKDYRACESNPKWKYMIHRSHPLYLRPNDIRNDFERDYTRIIHSSAYRRLKHKTQVFFSPESDHICTRIEHVTHVESISYTIAKYLGLNTDLTKSISVSHDLGHSPFGHKGEVVLSEISKRDIGIDFWHEKNGLELLDSITLLENSKKEKENLNLTYAVRDGIISHCGEIDENFVFPRNEFIDLYTYVRPNQFAPYTWEACVVKLSDKISYIGRDIEDAIELGILDNHLDELYKLLDYTSEDKINNTIIINHLISDLCNNSSPDKGLHFSDEAFDLLNKIKAFNYEHIYSSKRLLPSFRYFNIVINEIYDTLYSAYDKQYTLKNLQKLEKFYPNLISGFLSWLVMYLNSNNCEIDILNKYKDNIEYKNKKIFDINNPKDYSKSIIYYISGMTDNFAIETYNEIIGF